MMMKLMVIAMVVCFTGCATVKPCVAAAPVDPGQLECEPVDIGSTEAIGLVCSVESVNSFGNKLATLKTWAKATWQSCGPQKRK